MQSRMIITRETNKIRKAKLLRMFGDMWKIGNVQRG